MTVYRNDIRDLIAERLGYFGVTTQNTRIVTQMSLVQRNILEDGRLKPWFLRSLDNDLTLLAGARTVTLPSDFIKMDEDGGLWFYDSSADTDARYTQIIKDVYKTLVYKYGDNAADLPERYDLDKTYLYVFPKADSSDLSLKVNYYAREEDVASSNISNAWLTYAGDLYVAETLLRMGRILRDKTILNDVPPEIAEARQRLLDMEVDREMSDNDHQMGGDD